MKREQIIYLIAFMSAAMLGLLGLQFYWVNTSVQSNREMFVHNVHEALTEVVRKLEQQEAVNVLHSKLGDGITVLGDSVMMDVDSAGNVRWEEEKRIISKQVIGTSTLAKEGFAYEVEEETFIKTSGIARKNPLYKLHSEPTLETEPLQFVDSAGDPYAYQVMRKSDMVSSIVNELMYVSKGRGIRDRISKAVLDSLIGIEVLNKGIDIGFHYGIKDMSNPNGELLYCDNTALQDDIIQAGFSVRLFPTDAFGNRNQLYVYFPNKEQFIMHKMWGALIGGSIFLLLVIGCFVIAIMTIFKQKRISEITNDFISNMTHELKTPIATVSLTTEALLDPDIRAMPSLSDRYLHVIKEENDRLGQQVEKVLQIARMEKGDFKLRITNIDVHEVIENAIRNINIQVSSRNGSIGKDLQASLSTVEADKVHLTNIIYNLLDNANKYSPDAPEITIRTRDEKEGIRLFIADKGRGISKEMIGKVFDKFFRVPTGNLHDVKGFGLGLSYVKTMIDAHKGQISVKSEINKGTVFSIFLPYKHEA